MQRLISLRPPHIQRTIPCKPIALRRARFVFLQGVQVEQCGQGCGLRIGSVLLQAGKNIAYLRLPAKTRFLVQDQTCSCLFHQTGIAPSEGRMKGSRQCRALLQYPSFATFASPSFKAYKGTESLFLLRTRSFQTWQFHLNLFRPSHPAGSDLAVPRSPPFRRTYSSALRLPVLFLTPFDIHMSLVRLSRPRATYPSCVAQATCCTVHSHGASAFFR